MHQERLLVAAASRYSHVVLSSSSLAVRQVKSKMTSVAEWIRHPQEMFVVMNFSLPPDGQLTSLRMFCMANDDANRPTKHLTRIATCSNLSIGWPARTIASRCGCHRQSCTTPLSTLQNDGGRNECHNRHCMTDHSNTCHA